MATKIRVLMVAGTMNMGGQENQLMHLIRHADKKHYQIDFTTTDPNAHFREEIEALGGQVLLIPEINWKCPWKYIIALYKVMKRGKYHVVHSHELFHSGITISIAKLAGVPCRIAHSHSGSDGADLFGKKRSPIRSIYNKVMRFLILQNSTMQIACSTLAAKFLYGESILNKDTYHLVVNSVDTSRYLQNYGEKKWIDYCGYKNSKNILHVGHLYPLKNQSFLVDIANEFKKRRQDVRIFCAGHGNEDYIDEVKKKIASLHLEDRIILLGMRTDIDVLMREADVFVFPSMYEGMPLVMIEAQASGLPCVTADTFSREVDFELGDVQWLSLQSGPAVWADALEKAIVMGRADKQNVIDAINAHGFDSKIFAKNLCRLYKLGIYESRKKRK